MALLVSKRGIHERRKQLKSQDGIVQDDRVKVRALGFGVVRVFGAQGEVWGYGQAVGVGMKPLQEITRSHSLPLTGLPMFLVALAQKRFARTDWLNTSYSRLSFKPNESSGCAKCVAESP